ncbi:hypothetical protein, partial [Streptococcus danieliae]|uniref:hypothetical protein n=1 Tax=Streptococcus danieliae TaxID=747656 RepID=UPI0026EA15B4
VGNTGTLAGNWRASVSSFFDMMEDNWFLEVPFIIKLSKEIGVPTHDQHQRPFQIHPGQTNSL